MKHSAQEVGLLAEKAVDHLAPYITTITGIGGAQPDLKKYIGTGFFIELNGHTYIASAQHVADKLHKFEYLFHSVGDGNSVIQGHWVATTVPEADFGVMGCFDEALTHREKVLACHSEGLFNPNHSEDAYYLMMGYPGQLHTDLPFMNAHQHVLTPLVTTLKGVANNSNGDEILFRLNYSNKNVAPPGMSGSPIWNLNVHLEDDLSSWDVSKISVAGMITRWSSDGQFVEGTDARLIESVLPHVTQKFRELYPRTDK